MLMEPSTSLCELLRAGEKILIFTGAGVSTGSGIPDFRGPEGVWKRRAPVYYEDFMSSEKARIEHWDYKLEGWPAFKAALPNTSHRAIVQLERAGKLLKVVTQNIDGLHQKAGTSRGLLVELHGTSSEVECQSCHLRYDPDPHFVQFKETRRPPLCPECSGLLKPATISFGQNLHDEDIMASHDAAEQTDLVLALGSSLSVYPAASVPLLAAERGVPYVIINRGPTEHDGNPLVSLRLEGDVEELFSPAVAAALS